MKMRACLIMWAGAALLLSGCWSKMELTERAFVLAIAIDKGEQETFEVTSQIYRPASQFGAPSVMGTKSAYINVTLDGTSVSSIIRSTKTVSGRHSQLSHIQIILISEEIAREKLSSILDFFYRDPEFRLVTSVMIAKGKARDYLDVDSMIENTVGSQVLKQLKFSADMAGRSVEASLLDIAFQLKSESASAMLPIIARDRQFQKNVVHGIALAHPDKVVGRVVPDKVPFLMILAGKYKYGFIEIPCDGQSSGGQKETIEILKSHSRVTPVLEGDSVSARIDVHIEASVGELVCTTVRDMEGEKRYEQKVQQYLMKQMESVLDTLQKHKADVLGIGHNIYLRHPSRWRKLKSDWPERFAHIPIETTVEVHIQNSKIMNFSPFSRSDEE